MELLLGIFLVNIILRVSYNAGELDASNIVPCYNPSMQDYPEHTNQTYNSFPELVRAAQKTFNDEKENPLKSISQAMQIPGIGNILERNMKKSLLTLGILTNEEIDVLFTSHPTPTVYTGVLYDKRIWDSNPIIKVQPSLLFETRERADKIYTGLKLLEEILVDSLAKRLTYGKNISMSGTGYINAIPKLNELLLTDHTEDFFLAGWRYLLTGSESYLTELNGLFTVGGLHDAAYELGSTHSYGENIVSRSADRVTYSMYTNGQTNSTYPGIITVVLLSQIDFVIGMPVLFPVPFAEYTIEDPFLSAAMRILFTAGITIYERGKILTLLSTLKHEYLHYLTSDVNRSGFYPVRYFPK